jgi:hypothetical protein
MLRRARRWRYLRKPGEAEKLDEEDSRVNDEA